MASSEVAVKKAMESVFPLKSVQVVALIVIPSITIVEKLVKLITFE